MKYRFKFTKLGRIRFISHLDLVRLWQKMIKLAGIPIRYSAGFNPHQKMTIAVPLSLGIISEAEYIDIECTQEIAMEDTVAKLNSIMPEGIYVIASYDLSESYFSFSEISSALYEINVNEELSFIDFHFDCKRFLSLKHIIMEKRTKSGVKEEDIRSKIFMFYAYKEIKKLYLLISAGPTSNLKPELVLEAFYKYLGIHNKFNKNTLLIKRLEFYRLSDNMNIPLCSVMQVDDE